MVVGRFLESVWVLSGRVICHALSDNVVTLKKEASASHVCALEKTPPACTCCWFWCSSQTCSGAN